MDPDHFLFPVVQLPICSTTSPSLTKVSQPELHNSAVFAAFAPYPDLFTYLSVRPFATPAHLSEWYEDRFGTNLSATLFVVFDKTRRAGGSDGPALAGLIGLIETNPRNLVTEIGWVMILPDFQRTHVTTNAVGLLLHYCLDAGGAGGGATAGLGLRRVQWQANEGNQSSVRAATRLGFRYEGTMRWHRTLPPDKVGPASRASDPKPDHPGRHTVILSVCWDDWEGGVRDQVLASMQR